MVRAFWLDELGRTIFSFVHLDIDWIEFVLQELRSFVLCCLVGHIWVIHTRSNGRAAEGSEHLDAALLDEPFDPMVLHSRAVLVGKRFDDWQLYSLLLAAAFFPWTLYYWSLDHRWGDARYYVSTLVWHIVWGISWWCLSTSLLVAWREFAHYCARMQANLLASGAVRHDHSPEETDEQLKTRRAYIEVQMKWIAQARPVSTIHVVIAAAAALVTFILPFLKALR